MTSVDAVYEGLAHVVVAGGTPQEWLTMTGEQWAARLSTLWEGASTEGVQWITLLPHHGLELTKAQRQQLTNELSHEAITMLCTCTTVEVGHGQRYVMRNNEGLAVIIDPSPDGHVRFASTVESLRVAGIDPDCVEEETLSQAILAPADAEPDLVIILGPPDVIPESMVWELAYSELVFLDLGWDDLTPSDVELAIDDFTRRHRRFGGLDS
jgi:undecaprenyl diphosphate synthase